MTDRLWGASKEGIEIGTVYGNVLGLKHNQIRRLERLYQRRVSPEVIVSPELARQLTELSNEIHRQIGVLLDRQGHVLHVVVGDAHQIVLPDLKHVRQSGSRFCGLRCVHTHLNADPLTRDDLTDLALLRLDLMACLEVLDTGLNGRIQVAHLMPYSRAAGPESNGGPAAQWNLISARDLHQLDLNFRELISSLEAELARQRNLIHRHDQRERAILVSVTTGSRLDAEESLQELRQLGDSAGVVVLDAVLQQRRRVDPKFLIGRGKMQEVIIRALQLGADLIIFDQDLTPGQLRVIQDTTDLKAIDRTQLILDIFAQRARSREGKLQVELAQLRYLLPRLTQADTGLSRLTGGIGARGPGETKLEVDRRRVRTRIGQLETQVDQLGKQREQRRARRRRHRLPIISIVGYTNAGKSTLLNTLTRAEVLAESRLFATLDPTSRRLRLPRERDVIISDTVGFIRDLPPDLIAAFRATLEEIADSDLIVHLVDASQPQIEAQIAAVSSTLSELRLGRIVQLKVLNKKDLVDPEIMETLCRKYDGISVSAQDPASLGLLIERIDRLITTRGEEAHRPAWERAG